MLQTRQAEEPGERQPPVRHRHERHVHRHEKQEHDGQHRPGEVLEHPLDRSAEGQDEDDRDDERRRDPRLGGLIRRARHAAHPRAEQCCGRAAGQGRPSELEEAHEGIERGPEARARLEPHDAAVNRFAGIERVADRLEIEDDLQDDRDARDQEDRRRVLDRRGRTDQPFATADRRRRHHGAGADHLEQVAAAEGQRSGEIRHVPAGQLAVVGWKCASRVLGSHMGRGSVSKQSQGLTADLLFCRACRNA